MKTKSKWFALLTFVFVTALFAGCSPTHSCCCKTKNSEKRTSLFGKKNQCSKDSSCCSTCCKCKSPSDDFTQSCQSYNSQADDN